MPFGQLQAKIMTILKEGKIYTRKHIVDTLSMIYKQMGLNKKARHNDLYNFCEVKESRNRYDRYTTILQCKLL